MVTPAREPDATANLAPHDVPETSEPVKASAPTKVPAKPPAKSTVTKGK